MQVILYNNSSDRNDINKNISQIATLDNVHPVDAFNTMNPALKIGSVDYSTLQNANYAYIPDYSRYYYIQPMIITNNKVCLLPLAEDVLMSFKDEILSLTALVGRQENNYNLYLPDPEFKVYANTDKKTLAFNKRPFTKTPNFLLTVSGGV